MKTNHGTTQWHQWHQWHTDPPPIPAEAQPFASPSYDLLSVNKELKSVGLHFAFCALFALFSLFLCLFACLAFWVILWIHPPIRTTHHPLPTALSLSLSLSGQENAVAWPPGFPYQCVPYSRRADFILRSRQFRNKISPACKLKLQCNWLIHAYIMAIVAGLFKFAEEVRPVVSFRFFASSLFLAHFFIFLFFLAFFVDYIFH